MSILPTNLIGQEVLPVQATSDQNYQVTLPSTNTVKNLLNQIMSISGFIVSIDEQGNRTTNSCGPLLITLCRHLIN